MMQQKKVRPPDMMRRLIGGGGGGAAQPSLGRPNDGCATRAVHDARAQTRSGCRDFRRSQLHGPKQTFVRVRGAFHRDGGQQKLQGGDASITAEAADDVSERGSPLGVVSPRRDHPREGPRELRVRTEGRKVDGATPVYRRLEKARVSQQQALSPRKLKAPDERR